MEAVVYLVVQEYGTRASNDLAGVVPGDRVRFGDTVAINGRSFVPLWLVSDTGRRAHFPTFCPLDDLVGVLDFASGQTLREYEAGIRLRSALAMLSGSVGEIAALQGADGVREALGLELARWTL